MVPQRLTRHSGHKTRENTILSRGSTRPIRGSTKPYKREPVCQPVGNYARKPHAWLVVFVITKQSLEALIGFLVEGQWWGAPAAIKNMYNTPPNSTKGKVILNTKKYLKISNSLALQLEYYSSSLGSYR